ncbi:hypothetical protein QCA50_016037 [Cerrena zonata]|uniref:Bromo domain-containing protein n=1 Tax=Cerrena zonata TaxID=2478898 RepID=A0AAW0FN54_9APHY
MTKRTRLSRLEQLNGGFPGEDDDIVGPPKRNRVNISYNEESNEDDLEDADATDDNKDSGPNTRQRGPVVDDEDEDEDVLPPTSSDDEKDDPNEEDYVEDDEDAGPRRRGRKKDKPNRSRRVLSDDEDFEDDGEDPEDEFLEELKEKKFVATDDDESEDDYAYGSRPAKKRKNRSRSRSVEPRRGRLTRSRASVEPEKFEQQSEPEEEDSIRKEIEDLYDSSPDPSPIKHKLRERGKIDYTIPPPITNEAQFDSAPPIAANSFPSFNKGRPRKQNINKNEYRKILFPTAGPFGGSDVLSLFGTNIPPGGIPIPGMTDNNNLTAIGQNVSDSDSSEDEIAPINGLATVSKKPSKSSNPGQLSAGGNVLGSGNLIKAGGPNEKDKKKNNLSDTDPLGVDMNIDFSVVGGLDNYINQLKEMVALPLLYPELYQNFHITPPRGVLFHGPPGTGKTLMARALAASCSTSTRKITFFMRKGADCLSKWVGEAERQLRLLFEEAKNQQPSIIFFDEIDGLAPVRSSKQEQIHASIVSTLLALMDGMDNRGQVIVIGATNRPDSVDPALRRPGRFDREFYFPLPDINARSEILKIHTRKWYPPLPSEFMNKVAALTKGYGGADLRALCTEAALNSIQRKYPQIYQTNDKLKVDPTKVRVLAKDFMLAIDKIIPSSARSTSSGSAPLPDHLKPLLEKTFNEATDKLENLLPNSISIGKKKKVTALEEASYLDPTAKDADGGFSKQELLKNLENARICKPHLLICGDQGFGQQYISSAILNFLEGFQVQSLDLGNVFGDSTRTPELCIVQTFIEAKRHQPSIIFIPNIDIWFQVMPYSAKATLTGLLRNLKSTEKVLLLGISETNQDELDNDIKLMFGFNNESNNVRLTAPDKEARLKFFKTLENTLKMKPFEFINDLENRPKRKLKKLEILPQETPNDQAQVKKQLKEQEYNDTKLKNILKIKLAGLMDLFKNRYKRFRKPIIDENMLYHLFEPAILQNPLNQYEVLYIKSTDPKHKNMIQELSTGKFYYNMDLDIIEERLWNGYYSEAKQFLKDIKLIVKDAITSGDRERILKANEMLTNTQFGIDDFNNPEFAKACRDMREREISKQEKILEEHYKLQREFAKRQAENLNTLDLNGVPIPDAPLVTTNIIKDSTVEIESGEDKPVTSNGVSYEQPPVESNGKLEEDAKTETNLQQNQMKTNSAEEVESEHKDDFKETEKNINNEVLPSKATLTNPTASERSEDVNGPEVESESEAEEDLNHDLTRELILGDRVHEFFENVIPDITESYNIEKLEIAMAKFMDTIWTDRSKWDKTETVNKLFNVAAELKTALI